MRREGRILPGFVLILILVVAAGRSAAAGGVEAEVVRVHRNRNDVTSLRVGEGRLQARTASGETWSLPLGDLGGLFRDPAAAPHVRHEGSEARAAGPVEAVEPKSVAGWPVTSVAVFHGRVCYGTFGGGLRDEGGLAVSGIPSDVRGLAVAGDLLAVGTASGIVLWDGAAVREVRLPGPPDDDVSSLAWDGDSLWVGFFDGGLARLRGETWQTELSPGPPGTGWIDALCWDGAALWVGRETGLGRWDPEAGEVREVEGFGRAVHSVRSGPEGLAVAGPGYAALRRGKSWERLELPDDWLQTAVLSGGDLWAGGMQGALRRREGGWTRYSQLNGRLPDSWVTAVLPLDDAVWIGTYDAGLHVLDPSGRAHLLRRGVWVNPNALIRRGDLVAVGTQGDGLLLHDLAGGGWLRIGREEGLPADDVTAVLFVGNTLWAGTRDGLAEVRVLPAR